MKKIIFTSITAIIGLSSLFGQNCLDFKDTVSDDYSYNNETEDFSLPLNDTWEIIFENQKAILASLSNTSREGGVSVLKNINGITIKRTRLCNFKRFEIEEVKKSLINREL